VKRDHFLRMTGVALFAVAFGLVEASVVVYLRALYSPGGVAFPLAPLPRAHLDVELCREAATMVMLAALGWLAGKNRWNRLGFFLVSFGVWDLSFYAWLRLFLGWPASLLDWDILFLLPVPWIGPVLAPVSVAVIMVIFGAMIAARTSGTGRFRPGAGSWVLALTGTGGILISFMRDTHATLYGAMPEPYWYWLLWLSLACYGAAMAIAWRRGEHPGHS